MAISKSQAGLRILLAEDVLAVIPTGVIFKETVSYTVSVFIFSVVKLWSKARIPHFVLRARKQMVYRRLKQTETILKHQHV